MIIRFQLSLLAFRLFLEAPWKLPESAGSTKVISSWKEAAGASRELPLSELPGASGSFQASRPEAKSDNWNRIIIFVPAASRSFRNLPEASRKLPESRNAKSDNWNRIINFVLPAASGHESDNSIPIITFRKLPGSSWKLPEAPGKLPGARK